MLDDEEYAIVSKKEFLQLKKELDRLKKNPLEGSESGENLQASIDNLNKSLNVMLEVFKQASEDMKLEEHDTEMVSKQIVPINEKLETLIDQNQKIAKGIVAVADMVREKLEEMESKPKLPPLGEAPKPKPRSFAPQPAPISPYGPPPGSPYGPPPGSPFGGPPPMPPPMPGAPRGMDMPPLTPPGVDEEPQAFGLPQPPKKDIMGGLMR